MRVTIVASIAFLSSAATGLLVAFNSGTVQVFAEAFERLIFG